MKKSDFYYLLPEELIAQQPSLKRDHSRLLVYHKENGRIEHRLFKDIIEYLHPGDGLVLNQTRVIPARIYGRKESTLGKIEFVLLHPYGKENIWKVILKPGKRAKVDSIFVFGKGELKAKIIEISDDGTRIAEFYFEGDFEKILEQVGEIPLPPYIHTDLADKERYQTVYSKQKGSAAAPTAGLHFTNELLLEIISKKVNVVHVLLHVGLGTFRPVKADEIVNHHMHSEYYEITNESADAINKIKEQKRHIIAVGTTSTRTLEASTNKNGKVLPGSGWTNIFIYPGYDFKIIDGLITNFHLPESTLLMLVSALVGTDEALRIYHIAIEHQYRFFSFGDAMLVI